MNVAKPDDQDRERDDDRAEKSIDSEPPTEAAATQEAPTAERSSSKANIINK